MSDELKNKQGITPISDKESEGVSAGGTVHDPDYPSLPIFEQGPIFGWNPPMADPGTIVPAPKRYCPYCGSGSVGAPPNTASDDSIHYCFNCNKIF
ncbi:MAG: hypothetical protein PHU22_11245 [Eubacteriales bacterium]|nr:hypothetical protein [Eubacteriales bacterium]